MTPLLAAALLVSPTLRPPAVPLFTHTPYFSAWCMGDSLTDGWPRHWTTEVNAAQGLVRIDGKTYRWMGADTVKTPALKQTSVEVHATRSIFTFQDAGIELKIEFLSPLFTDDIEILARPVSYVTASARAIDGSTHDVDLYVDFTGEWVTENGGQKVDINRHRIRGLESLTITATNGSPLHRSGDMVTIDWGTLAVAAPSAESSISGHSTSRNSFAAKGSLPEDDDLRFPRAADDDWPVAAIQIPLGKVNADTHEGWFMVALDEIEAIEYFRRKLPPYWKRKGMDLGGLLKQAADDYPAIRQKSQKFDAELATRLRTAGGEQYALMGALAYRQCLAAHTIVEDLDGDLLMFSKENSSNGCLATVDVTFPAAPFFLALNPELLEAQLRPVFEYAASSRWPWPFAPHDLGQFPLANGQVYGGGERTEENQMPVEESANMIIMTEALARHGRTSLRDQYRKQLDLWADYLAEHGIDPANQLCTDDFAGHLARNANLSVKSIVALKAMSRTNEAEEGLKFYFSEAGRNPSKLAFGATNTWGLKYNMVWDKVLLLNLFPDDYGREELQNYLRLSNDYGVPLDNRAEFTKTDWIFWCGAMGDRQTQDNLIAPVFKMLNETPDRLPFTDWYETKSAKTKGMRARSVIGGIYMPLYVRELESHRP